MFGTECFDEFVVGLRVARFGEDSQVGLTTVILAPNGTHRSPDATEENTPDRVCRVVIYKGAAKKREGTDQEPWHIHEDHGQVHHGQGPA